MRRIRSPVEVVAARRGAESQSQRARVVAPERPDWGKATSLEAEDSLVDWTPQRPYKPSMRASKRWMGSKPLSSVFVQKRSLGPLARPQGIHHNQAVKPGMRRSNKHSISGSAVVKRLIPTDKTFTIADIMAGLKAIDPDRGWRKRSVENRIRWLVRRGLIKRVKDARGGNPAVYAHSDIPIDPEPSKGTTLADVAASCLEDGPMTLAELVVAILESGYEAKTDKKTLLRSVGSALRRNPERFMKTGDKWAVRDRV